MIDLDHNATTPLDARVRAAMIELLGDPSLDGNPSSVHGRGRRARAVVEDARRSVAAAVGAEPLGVTFTSGGTEADALAILGTCRALRQAGRPCALASSKLEHPAVRGAGELLAREGIPQVFVPFDEHGRIEAAAVVETLRAHPEVGLVSLATANNELGNVYDIAGIVAAVRGLPGRELLVHSDAVQAFGKYPVDFAAADLDLMSVSSHKIHGPKGVGALIHRPHLRIDPLWIGGSQERGRRVGTEAVPAIHGFGVAAGLVAAELDQRRAHVAELHAQLLAGLAEVAPGHLRYGDPDRHLGNTALVGFPGCPGELLLMNLDLEGVAVSTGSACNSGKFAASKVLLTLLGEGPGASEALRFSLGKDNSAAEIARVLALLPGIVARVREERGCA
ncbi:cysteine desulfurase [Pseudenhygromyxa sp. WMMC2535]|uniref:aminotransferase class V-fold PLP-dependent enzyme n=1 Tax=Pseudenhygromyxa sp. WMMC2535 TaxID=2712867 RepID=UPI0015531CD4|nr:cysteine desulfurase [Pseudenhygromyxa sp. WMMC2535]